MTRAQLGAIGKRLLPALPGFARRQSLLFRQPIEHTLLGILLDRSGDSRSFYVYVFIQPLSVPADDLMLNASWRLGGGAHIWNADAAHLEHTLATELIRKAIPFFAGIQNPRDVARALVALGRSMDPIVVKMTAYSHARAGEIQEATMALDRLLTLLAGDVRPYVRQMFDETSAFKALLLEEPAEAERRLTASEAKTAEALGLTRFADFLG